MGTEGVKKCPECSTVKALTEFYRSTKDGHTSYCKPCTNERKKAWRKANPDKVRAGKSRHWHKHAERERAKQRKRYATDPRKKEALKKSAAKRLASGAKALSSQKHYIKNKDAYKARAVAWRAANPEAVMQAIRRNRAKRDSAPGSATAAQVTARIAYFGNQCAYCGGPFEEIDHTIPLAKGGTKWAANLRPACRKCNQSKNGRTPREWEAALELEAAVFRESRRRVT